MLPTGQLPRHGKPRPVPHRAGLLPAAGRGLRGLLATPGERQHPVQEELGPCPRTGTLSPELGRAPADSNLEVNGKASKPVLI